MNLVDLLETIFNATMIGVGTALGNYIAPRHLIGTMQKLRNKKKN